jgi:putative glycerol-1-phosphate prenyltransferase
MEGSVFLKFSSESKQLAVLVDPDKCNQHSVQKLVSFAHKNKIDYFFVGGSIITSGSIAETVMQLKRETNIPVILFPGNASQVYEGADALLFLSLISGRNPDLLIGQHVLSAKQVAASGLDVIPTGYILIDSGNVTTVQYISNTRPIPHDNIDLAVSTALAGKLLGLKTIYLEAGSGARRTVPEPMIAAVKKHVKLPLIVGGGIRSREKTMEAFAAGADIVVVGNALESNPDLMDEIAEAKHVFNVTLKTN